MNEGARHDRSPAGFTLIELLVVVAIIALLAAIAVVNMRLATERANKSAGAANLRTIAVALQMYVTDYGKLPLGDQAAGPFSSQSEAYSSAGDGPAAGGSWNGVPWILVDLGYIGDQKALFCPKYLKLYQGGATVLGQPYPRYHNFRYAYNAGNASSGDYSGGTGNINSGEHWIVRDLYLAADQGFYADNAPAYPADFVYPWGEGDYEDRLEHVLYADFSVKTVIGGTDKIPKY